MATDRVSIGQMADAIMDGLEEYASLATAPNDTGKYAKSWAVKT